MKNAKITLTLTADDGSAESTAVAVLNVGELNLPFDHASTFYLRPLYEQALASFHEQREHARKAAN